MFRNYLKMALRNLWKHRFYTFLNVFGLSLGIAGGLVLLQFIRFHLSFDQYHPHTSQVYRLVTELHLDDGSTVHEQGSPLAMGPALQQQQSGIAAQAVHTNLPVVTVGVPGPAQTAYFTEHDNVAFVGDAWFTMFAYHFLQGNYSKAPGDAVITASLARKYFGSENAIGKTLRLDSKYDITIRGVMADLPDHTDLPANLLLSDASFQSFSTEAATMLWDWNYIKSNTQTYVQLQEGTDPNSVNKAMTGLRNQHFPADIANVFQFTLQPLNDIHFNPFFGGTMQRSLLTTLAFVGIFLVVIACFNFINLATAQSARRAREIGTRKVLGSAPQSIFWQFILETTCVTAVAMLLAFAWIFATRAVMNNWMQVSLSFNPLTDPWLALGTAGLLLFIIGTGGSYPAIVMSRYKPADAFRGQRLTQGNGTLRKGLIIVQHVVVQALLIAVCVITLQVKHLKNVNLGFNKSAVMMVNIPDAQSSNLSYLHQQLTNIHGVQSVSFCMQPPSSSANVAGSVSYDNKSWESFSPNTILGDDQYLQTFGLQLLAGRNIAPSDTVRQFLVNETLLHKLGYKEPQAVIGHSLVAGALSDHPGTIVGVVKDFNIHSLYSSIPPLMLTSKKDRYQYAAIKVNAGTGAALADQVKQAWQAMYPDKVFEYHFLDTQIDAFYHKEDLLHKLINTTAIIAILISCMGLLGLISFFTLQRTREIGIRKVLGASVPGIIYLLSRDFLSMVCISLLVAVPLSWYSMQQWLNGFAYRIQISPWVLLFTALCSLVITFISIGFQAMRAALANPVESLKAE